MPLDPNVIQQVTSGLETAYQAGLRDATTSAQQRFFGGAASVLTARLFAAALAEAGQMLRAYSAEAADFFQKEADRFTAFASAPEIRQVEPADAANGVGLHNIVSVQFVRLIDPDTLSQDTFFVTPAAGGAHLGGEVVYDPETLSASFTPSNPLAAGTAYKATLAAGLKADGGQALGAPHTWTFTTGAS